MKNKYVVSSYVSGILVAMMISVYAFFTTSYSGAIGIASADFDPAILTETFQIGSIYPTSLHKLGDFSVLEEDTNIPTRKGIRIVLSDDDLFDRSIAGRSNPLQLVLINNQTNETVETIEVSDLQNRQYAYFVDSGDLNLALYIMWPGNRPYTEYKGKLGTIQITTSIDQLKE